MIGQWDAVVLCERRRVKRVLGYGDEDASFVGSNECVQEERNACRRASREEDVFRVTWVTIALFGDNESVSDKCAASDLPSMNCATCFRMSGIPLLCEYAPTLPISVCSCCARAMTSSGHLPFTRSTRGGYSMRAATYWAWRALSIRHGRNKMSLQSERRGGLDRVRGAEKDRGCTRAPAPHCTDAKKTRCGDRLHVYTHVQKRRSGGAMYALPPHSERRAER